MGEPSRNPMGVSSSFNSQLTPCKNNDSSDDNHEKNIFNSTKTKQNKKLTKLPFSLRISLRFLRSDFRLCSL
ncbi:hypothetical protein QYF36_003871 [Acer negundo]|nr:hypothetical protein QYF36_003871 [Acer negundo]